MIMSRQSGLHKRSAIMKRGCCCVGTPLCFEYRAAIVCGADGYECYYRQFNPINQFFGTLDRWQPYCLRGLVYYNHSISFNEDGDADYLTIASLNEYDACVRRGGYDNQNRSNGNVDCIIGGSGTKVNRAAEYYDEYNFGCVDLNPILETSSAINWRCVARADVLPGLAGLVPQQYYNVSHTVVLRVDYWRHIYGDCTSLDCLPFRSARFYSSDIHMFWIDAFAVFDNN